MIDVTLHPLTCEDDGCTAPATHRLSRGPVLVGLACERCGRAALRRAQAMERQAEAMRREYRTGETA
jgi:hypothetical protein